MIYTYINYGLNDTNLNPLSLPNVQPGDIFIGCNFSRKMPYTFLFPNIEIYFIDCNLSGCDIQPSWVVDDYCFIAQNEWDTNPPGLIIPEGLP